MSLDMQRAHSFFGPLSGKTTTFLVEGRDSNLALAKCICAFLSQGGGGCSILDLDAFYSSNSEAVFGPLPTPAARSIEVRVPEAGAVVEEELPWLYSTESGVVILDSLNSLYHLLSIGDGGSRGRKLSFAVEGLSYLARTGRRAVFLVMYRREAFPRSGGGRSISTLSDLTVSVGLDGQRLLLKCERGTAWPGGSYSIRTT
ncbi:MAG: hypothetical protein HY297_03665 [Thaumarchaeota archaeon]|nr:hypothetical protein [Nitrososphaerota archaeon]